MTEIFFDGGIQRFDGYIGRTTGRNALLLLENCSALGESDTLPTLQNVRVDFLPPRKTTKIQPLDAGITSLVETKFCKRLLFRILENIDRWVTSIYNIDV